MLAYESGNCRQDAQCATNRDGRGHLALFGFEPRLKLLVIGNLDQAYISGAPDTNSLSLE